MDNLTFLSRSQINSAAWDACVAESAQAITYGYSWYLDAVLPGPNWKWIGLVLPDANRDYRAVMPVPLRRKFGIWRVHQPLFCQTLGVFSRDAMLDPTPFYRAMHEQFRYGSLLHSHQYPSPNVPFDVVRQLSTHVLDLSVGYNALHQRFTSDRRRNLRRATTTDWTIVDSTDPEPLITLFRANHADGIQGGVADWAYVVLRRLYVALHERGLATLRYALRDGRTEAGALFVTDVNRIIYLFNAASETGRRGNARTLLIDQMIRENAGRGQAEIDVKRATLLDFESPPKPSVRAFYVSFGAVEQPFWTVRWNQLTWPERTLLAVWRRINRG